jgi:N-acetylmuramoyl-L-alanine amidase
VKHFIRFKLRNLTVAGLALIMAATFAVPFFAYPDQLMADTQDDLDAVNKQLEELRSKQSELNASYGELNEKLSASGEKLSSIEDAVNAKQSEIDATNIQVADMQAEIDQQYASMKLRIQFMYENNNATILSTLLSAESLSDLLSKSEYIQQISNYDHQKMQELSDLLASLKETQAKLEQEMAELVTLKDDAAREADNFAVLLSQCQTELDTTSDSISDAEALALEYEKQIEQELLERQRREMEALEAARKAQEEADKANNSGNSSNTGGNSSSGSAMVDQNALNNVLKNHTAEDVAMLAAIIECEAGNQSYEGKCAVGSVVINRVADPRFANSISGVIYAPYQFSPVASGRFAIVLARGANAACTQAAVDVLNGYININALYFHVYDSSVDVGGTVIGDHVFY